MIAVYSIGLDDRLYIGSSFNVERRLRDHRRLLIAGKHHNIHLQRAFRLNIDSLKFKILVKFHPAVDEVVVRSTEASLVKLFSRRYRMVNIATVGASPNLGRKMSRETREKCSTNMRQQWESGVRVRVHPTLKSDEFVRKMTAINRTRAQSSEHLAHLKRQAQAQCEPERRTKSSERMKTLWTDTAFREAVVRSMVRGADNPKSRTVQNVDTGEVFETVVSAAKSVARTSGSLVEAIQRKGRCGGFYFKYVDTLV